MEREKKEKKNVKEGKEERGKVWVWFCVREAIPIPPRKRDVSFWQRGSWNFMPQSH